jgi:hypothetical protein
VTGPGVQADQARHGGWGRERSVTNKPGPDFDRLGPAWGVGEGEVSYRQTRPETPRFRPDRNEVPSPRTDIHRVVMHWKLSALQCRISNLFLWSSNSIMCLCFCYSEEERKCLIKVPKKPQDLALQNCVSRIFFLCLDFIIFACLAISSKQIMVLLMHETYAWAAGV